MQHEIDRVLIDRGRIARRVAEIGERLSADLAGRLRAEGVAPEEDHDRVVMLPIMTGAFVFTADLIRQMSLKLSISLITVQSYPGTSTRSKGATLRGALPTDLAGRHVVVIDDILDSGRTLGLVRDLVMEQGAASLVTCVLLNKLVPKAVELEADYAGFDIPDEFVVGYGLDFDGYYRNLPEIVTLRRLGDALGDATPQRAD